MNFYSANLTNTVFYSQVYKGCYVDFTSYARDLPLYANGNSIDKCLTACGLKNTRYFGVQNGFAEN